MEELIDIPKLFGENLKKIRKQKNLTQSELAEKLDVTQKHLSVIETGTQFASATLISKIAHVLDVTPSELFGGVSSEAKIVNDITTRMVNLINPKFATLYTLIEDLKKK